MENFENILNEIQSIKKMMNLSINESDLKKLLIIKEQGEGKLVRDILEEFFPSIAKYEDDALSETLQKNPLSIRMGGKDIAINSMDDINKLCASYRTANYEVVDDGEALRSILKSNKETVTNFKRAFSESINYMDMKLTRTEVIAQKSGYVAESPNSLIPIKPGINLDLSTCDEVLDDFERTFLGKNGMSRDIGEGSFNDGFTSMNIDTQTSAQLTDTAKKVPNIVRKFKDGITKLRGKIADELQANRITTEEANTLNNKVSTLQKKGDEIFTQTKEFYERASKTKEKLEESTQKFEIRDEPIFDVNPLTKVSDEEKKLYEDLNASIVSEALGTKGKFLTWLSNNKYFFNSSAKFLQMPIEGFITFVQNYKRIISRSDKNSIFAVLDEVMGKDAGAARYSYDEIRVRYEYITNQMLEVVRENLEVASKEGESSIKQGSLPSVERKLRDLMRQMQDIASLQRYAGNLDDISKNTDAINDETRIKDVLGEAEFLKLDSLIIGIKKNIEKAATEGVTGAKELNELWETTSQASLGGRFKTFSEFFVQLDEYMKSRKSPNSWKDLFTSLDGWNDLIIFAKYIGGFFDKETRGSYKEIGEELLGGKSTNKVGKFTAYALDKLGPVGDAAKVTGGALVSFFKSSIKTIYTEFVLNALYNQFKYGRMTSIAEMDRILLKYGPGKSTIILLIREMFTKLTFGVLATALYYTADLIDRILGVIIPGDADRPVQSMFYGALKWVGEKSEAASEGKANGFWLIVDADGALLTASEFNEWAQKDFSDRIKVFFSNPVNLKKLIVGAGIPADILNVLTAGYSNKWFGLNDDPDYFQFSKDMGWFNSQIDECIVQICGTVIAAAFGGNTDLRDGAEEMEQLISDADRKVTEWQQKGILWGKETVAEEAREKAEKTVTNEIDKSNDKIGQEYSQGPKEFISNTDLFDKFKTIVTSEFEPDFNAQLDQKGLTGKQRDAEGIKLWKDWFYGNNLAGVPSHKDFVGVTDAKMENGIIKNGDFYRIDTGVNLAGNSFKWSKMIREGKVVPSIINKTPESHLYIQNPKDGKLYHLSRLFDVISEEKILQLYGLRHTAYETKINIEKWKVYEKNYSARIKQLDKYLEGLEKYLTEDQKKDYPETYALAYAKKHGGKIKDPIDGTEKKYEGYLVEKERLTKDYETNKKKMESYLQNPKVNENIIKKIIMSEMKKYNRQRLFEEEEQRFGENKFDHWYDTFTFQKYDEKTNDFKDIDTDTLKHGLIKDRFNDFIKNYDGDDAFVRAVVDTHPDVVRIKYLKDQANIQETYYPTGLASVLSLIRESKGEYDIFSVSRLKGGNWHLVKGDFTQKEMSNMVLTKQVPPEKQPKQRENGLESLKKKEATGTTKLASDETEGLKELPKRVKEKLKEKISKGWTTETPPKVFHEFYEESELNSVFNDKIKIYKLEPTPEFFNSLKDNSSHVLIRKGFCRSMTFAKRDGDISNEQRKVVNHILNKCDEKFEGKLGLSYLSKKV